MPPELIRSAERIARIMPADADWWIIGSAALALSGIPVQPKDVDVFAASAVVEPVRLALGVAATPSGSERFRSSPYFQFQPEGALPIDFMGGLEVASAGAWVALHIESRIPVRIGNATLFIPTLEEQAAILRLFGRPKDLARAALIADRK